MRVRLATPRAAGHHPLPARSPHRFSGLRPSRALPSPIASASGALTVSFRPFTHRSPVSSSFFKKRLSPIKPGDPIDYKDIDLLKKFITERGKILPRRLTGLTAQQQRDLTNSVKRARILALLPFVNPEG